MAGPLAGVRVVELAGIGPGPFAGMLLADLGADVLRVDRPNGNPMATLGHDVLLRNRRSIAVDLKHAGGPEVVLRLCEGSDALFEGNRPGVAERLGVGPDAALARNPALVYARMTGWGQDGPLAQAAGHDVNYLGLSGALHAIGREDSGPVPPLNLVADFGGGGMLLAVGLLAALVHARTTGEGQVVDVSMVEGASALLSMQVGMHHQGMWSDQRGSNLLDTGAYFYDVYETADGRWIALGAIEPAFHAEMVRLMDLDTRVFTAEAQLDPAGWPRRRALLAERVAERTRDEWDAVLLGTDACYAPVLSIDEAPKHPHAVARRAWTEVDGQPQPRPVPRFSATPTDPPRSATAVGTETVAVLADAGFGGEEVDRLVAEGVVAVPD